MNLIGKSINFKKTKLYELHKSEFLEILILELLESISSSWIQDLFVWIMNISQFVKYSVNRVV